MEAGAARGCTGAAVTLLEIIAAAAARFDARPRYRASIEARAELQRAADRAGRVVADGQH